MAILATGIALVPFRLTAQETTPAATASSETKHESAKPSEEQQNNVFRLEGPVVKWTAKTLNLSPEKTADIFEVANFLIIALAVGIPLFRFLPRYLRQRKQKIREDIESARKVTEDANARLSAVEAKLAKIDDEIQKFRSEVDAESKGDEARIKASLTEESARIVEASQQEIGMAAAQARRGLRHYAADLAIERAAKELNLTAEIDRKLIAEFVGDVAAGSSKGGVN